MKHISDIVDFHELQRLIADGYVKQRQHPSLLLWIFNYTAKTQYEHNWTPTTMACRGIITDDGGCVIARPFPKFFNYGQEGAAQFELDEPCITTDKMDGSLGILYPTPDGLAIATRGSFESEQAIHATKVLRERYADFVPSEGWTYLFEIVCPSNRIIVDYGDVDDLFMIGMVRNDDGLFIQEVPYWTGPSVENMYCHTVAEALSLPPRKNVEGIVITLRDGRMVKIKQEDYVALHKLVCGMNERVVWERLGAGETCAQICEQIPDEFHGWVNAVGFALMNQAGANAFAACAKHNMILEQLGEGYARKDYAALAVKHDCRALLFGLLDGKDIAPMIWKELRPSGANSMRSVSEDVA